MDGRSELYDRAVLLQEQGQDDDALDCVHEYLLHNPRDFRALKLAATLLHSLGRSDEGARHMEAAISHMESVPPELQLQLSQMYLSSGQAERALKLFDELSHFGLLSGDFAAEVAERLLSDGKPAAAMEAAIHAWRSEPREKTLESLMNEIRACRAKLAIFCDDDMPAGFRNLHTYLSRRMQTRVLSGVNTSDMSDAMNWCDIACFHSMSGLSAAASQSHRCKLLGLLESRSIYDPCVEDVNWSRVNTLAIWSSLALPEFLRRRLIGLGLASSSLVSVPMGVDVEKMPLFPDRNGKNIVAVGDLDTTSNPSLLLQCFSRLHEMDSEWRLHFLGYFRDDMLEHYMRGIVSRMGLDQSVTFTGWQSDMTAWLSDKTHVAWSGLSEFPMSVLECMAAGLFPLIHSFPGAETLLPSQYIFRTVDEFCRMAMSGHSDADAIAGRWIVCQKFPIDVTMRRINDLIVTMEMQCRQKTR